LERPGAVKGAPLFGAAKRTLDREDRSKILELEGKDRGNGDGSQFDTNVQNIVVRYINRRRSKSRGKLFFRLMQQAVGTSPKTYDNLIGGTKTAKRAPQQVGVG